MRTPLVSTGHTRARRSAVLALPCALLTALGCTLGCSTPKRGDAPARETSALAAERAAQSEAASTASAAQAAAHAEGKQQLEPLVLSIERARDAVTLVVQNHGSHHARMKPSAQLLPASSAKTGTGIAGVRLDGCKSEPACLELAPGGELRATAVTLRAPTHCGCTPCELPKGGEHVFAIESCAGGARLPSPSFALATATGAAQTSAVP